MLTLAGYAISEVIHNGARTAVYRATRTGDGQSVILKLPQAEFPTLEENDRLRREYEILKGFDTPHVVTAYCLEQHQNRWVLVLEDSGGISLKHCIPAKGMDLRTFLEIAIQICKALEVAHQKKIIHRDIKPKNILMNVLTKAVKLIDFSISSYLSQDHASTHPSTQLEGTLAYISPEQTGRMSRRVDYRSDLYSLGATFYELLTGNPPFVVTDPLELIHCHLLKQPVDLLLHRPSLPPVVAQLVMKLLEKNAEDRYQSIFGLRVDLEHCQRQVMQTGAVTSFPLGQQDQSGYLLIPQRLYGREQERGLLSTALERIVTKANPATVPFQAENKAELLLIRGPAGIGKTALVQNFQQSLGKREGYFISGKGDVARQEIPYRLFTQALEDLIRQLLAETSEQLDGWRQHLHRSLGQNLQPLLEFIPALETIVQPHSPIPPVEPAKTQISFHEVFQTFLQIFAQPDHPLVMVLDDLQWADPASLNLLQTLMTSPYPQALLIVGTYRDNEVNPDHPLHQTIAQLQQQKAIVHPIELPPLNPDAATHLLRDALGQPETVASFANLLWKKNEGNPLLLTQSLRALYQDGLLHFNFHNQQWGWDLKTIAEKDLTHVIPTAIQKLPAATQHLLKLAASLGNRFSLEALAAVSNKTLSATAADLWTALQADILLPISQVCTLKPNTGEDTAVASSCDYQLQYQFAHNQMQEAAQALILDRDEASLHQQIEQSLLEHQDNPLKQVHPLRASHGCMPGLNHSRAFPLCCDLSRDWFLWHSDTAVFERPSGVPHP
ncbi:MAG: AAA family ATPase [Leptolyngbyaceae cyanobacterium bins.59]|nr:AAA family ATPase [Leptolyngbyaceae cyanobacterium bins.59]